MEENVLFWQTCIKITQAPIPFDPLFIPDSHTLPFEESHELRSFLDDPLNRIPLSTYGLEITYRQNLEVKFFTTAKSEEDGIELGYCWLSNLKYKFTGLDGKVKAEPITQKKVDDWNMSNIVEIKLPDPAIRNKVNIIERFINSFYYSEEIPAQLLIMWQRIPLEEHKINPQVYYLRIFIRYKLNTSNLEQILKFKGTLRFLFSDIENTEGKRASMIDAFDLSLLDLLNGKLFGDESLCMFSNLSVNFDFPEVLPLPRIPILENENVRYIDLTPEFINYAISVGNHVKNGVITNHLTYIPIHKLPQDMVIFGKSGSGKTYFLARFIKELCQKAKNVGILVLNVAKQSQDIYYNDFHVIKYSDDDFHIPYFINDDKNTLEKCMQETATYICASLGLKNVYEKIIYRSGIGLIKLKGRLPDFLIDLLIGVYNYMNKNKYGPETQANLIQALKNRITVFDEDKVQNVLKISEELPEWVNEWKNGGKIFLDLSMCNKYVKMIIVNAIFQLVRTVTKDIEAEDLKQLIVIDEAHAILEKPITTNSDDADFIMKEQMAKIFSELLKEYRSRGVGFIIADQSPDSLFKDVASQPSIKIIFREDYPNNIIFSEVSDERQMLTKLPKRLALVINGATGERYLIKTIEYKF